MSNVKVTEWCVAVAEVFRKEEPTIVVPAQLQHDRDAALIHFALRSLVVTQDGDTARLLEDIDRLRVTAGRS